MNLVGLILMFFVASYLFSMLSGKNKKRSSHSVTATPSPTVASGGKGSGGGGINLPLIIGVLVIVGIIMSKGDSANTNVDNTSSNSNGASSSSNNRGLQGGGNSNGSSGRESIGTQLENAVTSLPGLIVIAIGAQELIRSALIKLIPKKAQKMADGIIRNSAKTVIKTLKTVAQNTLEKIAIKTGVKVAQKMAQRMAVQAPIMEATAAAGPVGLAVDAAMLLYDAITIALDVADVSGYDNMSTKMMFAAQAESVDKLWSNALAQYNVSYAVAGPDDIYHNISFTSEVCGSNAQTSIVSFIPKLCEQTNDMIGHEVFAQNYSLYRDGRTDYSSVFVPAFNAIVQDIKDQKIIPEDVFDDDKMKKYINLVDPVKMQDKINQVIDANSSMTIYRRAIENTLASLYSDQTNPNVVEMYNALYKAYADGTITKNSTDADYEKIMDRYVDRNDMSNQASTIVCNAMGGHAVIRNNASATVDCSFFQNDCRAQWGQFPLSDNDHYTNYRYDLPGLDHKGNGACITLSPLMEQTCINANNRPYDDQKGTCVIDRSYCLSKAATYKPNRKLNPYVPKYYDNNDDCFISAGQKVLEAIFSKTVVDSLIQVFSMSNYESCRSGCLDQGYLCQCPAQCPAGYGNFDGTVCYAPCSTGYTFSAGLCNQNSHPLPLGVVPSGGCADGTNEWGGFCYNRTCNTGYSYDGMSTCNLYHRDVPVGTLPPCRSGYTNITGLCYKNPPDHWKFNTNIVAPTFYVPENGYNGLTYPQNPGVKGCASNVPDEIAGLCYETCPPGMSHLAGVPTQCVNSQGLSYRPNTRLPTSGMQVYAKNRSVDYSTKNN